MSKFQVTSRKMYKYGKIRTSKNSIFGHFLRSEFFEKFNFSNTSVY